MSSTNEETNELSILLKETAEEVVGDYYFKFCDALSQLGISEDSGPIPLEVWAGLAQALADASGYRVILQASVLKADPENPQIYQRVAHRDVAIADPTLFVATN